MKETIYTIPINEAFDKECMCPICEIQDKTENDNISYTLGPAMMEPDFRVKSNELGFCKNHYKMLINEQKALPLSLVLQTHISHQNKKILSFKVKEKHNKSSFFNKKADELVSAKNMINAINNINNSCLICKKIQSTMERYYDNIIYIWKTQQDFKNKFASKYGFCLPHFLNLLECALKNLNQKDFSEFYHTIVPIEEKKLEKMYDDISAFTRLFDHNSDRKATDDVKNSIKNSISTYSGKI